MEYSFKSHIASIVTDTSRLDKNTTPLRLFALVDQAQIPGLQKQLTQQSDWIAVPLFKDCFADSALDLSPLLIELSGDVATQTQQFTKLDAACASLPILSMISARTNAPDLIEHLQSLLSIEADGTSYLLRLADTQAMTAANTALSPQQRAAFYRDIAHWWVVDYQTQLVDLAVSEQDKLQVSMSEHIPLRLNADQTNGLLTGAMAAILASQLRNLEPSFAQQRSHVQQMAFVSEIIAAHHQDGVVDENDIADAVLQRWADLQAQ